MTHATAPGDSGELRPRSHRRKPPRRRVSIVGVFGEVLITAGVIVLLFLGWQTWWNSAVLSGQQTNSAASQSQKWLGDAPTTPDPKASSTDYGPPPTETAPAAAQPLAVIYVPRFGADWKRTIRETVDTESVLNSYDAGVGHYPKTAMPGGVGNFAIAAHDTGYGNAFLDVSDLRVGDHIYIQTQQGWYTYTFRNMEYVQPTATDVLLPVPTVANANPTDRLITMTTCNPPYHAQERIIAYGTYTSWQPLSAGPPQEIAAEVAAQSSGGN
jgi:sortase A